RNFEIVEFHNRIIDTETIKGGEQVFDSRNPYAAIHQSRRISDPLHRADIGPKLEIVQIDAAKNDTRAGRSGQNPHGGRFTRMQANAAEFNWTGDGLFSHELRALQSGGLIGKYEDLRS